MSLQEELTVHLGDYRYLVQKLVAAVAQPDDASCVARVRSAMNELLDKDKALQAAVGRLVEHQLLQRSINRLRSALDAADRAIVSFASRLGSLEQGLHDAARGETAPRHVDGHETRQRFTAREVLVFAERLGPQSAQGFLEQDGISRLHKVWAPQLPQMSDSHLKLPLESLAAKETWAWNATGADAKDSSEPQSAEKPAEPDGPDWAPENPLSARQLAKIVDAKMRRPSGASRENKALPKIQLGLGWDDVDDLSSSDEDDDDEGSDMGE